jgi:hypothetical protein
VDGLSSGGGKGRAEVRVFPAAWTDNLLILKRLSGAGYGDRTRVAGLGSQCITTMLSPPLLPAEVQKIVPQASLAANQRQNLVSLLFHRFR